MESICRPQVRILKASSGASVEFDRFLALAREAKSPTGQTGVYGALGYRT